MDDATTPVMVFSAMRSRPGMTGSEIRFTFQTAKFPTKFCGGARHRPYSLSRPRAGRSSLGLLPLRMRGDGAPGGAAVVRQCPDLLAKMRKRLPARHPDIFQCPGSFAVVFIPLRPQS